MERGYPTLGNDKVIWEEFGHRPDELQRISDTIRSFIHSDTPIPPKEVKWDDEEEGEEGDLLTRTHRYRERNTKIVKKKKKKVVEEQGTLKCEVCGFDFVRSMVTVVTGSLSVTIQNPFPS